jgi:hypothetical protein
MTYLSDYAQVKRLIWQVKSPTIRTTLACILRISIQDIPRGRERRKELCR